MERPGRARGPARDVAASRRDHGLPFSRARTRTATEAIAHLADVASFAVIDSMVVQDSSRPGISAELAARTKAAYLEEAERQKGRCRRWHDTTATPRISPGTRRGGSYSATASPLSPAAWGTKRR